jgi:hypothetical protein
MRSLPSLWHTTSGLHIHSTQGFSHVGFCASRLLELSSALPDPPHLPLLLA